MARVGSLVLLAVHHIARRYSHGDGNVGVEAVLAAPRLGFVKWVLALNWRCVEGQCPVHRWDPLSNGGCGGNPACIQSPDDWQLWRSVKTNDKAGGGGSLITRLERLADAGLAATRAG